MTDALLEKVKRIPHLELGLTFDVPRMLDEVALVQRFDPYTTRAKRVREQYALAWSGACLNSRDGDPYTEMTEEPSTAKTAPRLKTQVGEMCPYLWGISEQLGTVPLYRARIMRIAPGSTLVWHSHVQQHGQPETTLTLHVPIIVPLGFEYQVMGTDSYKSGSHDPIYSARYEPGQATIFNSYHYHNVSNPSAEYRVSLMLYASLNDHKFRALVDTAAQLYSGPFID